MNYIEAMNLVFEGKKVRLSTWAQGFYLEHSFGNIYCVLNNERKIYIPKYEAINSTYWEEYIERKYMNFIEAMEKIYATQDKHATIEGMNWFVYYQTFDNQYYLFSKCDGSNVHFKPNHSSIISDKWYIL